MTRALIAEDEPLLAAELRDELARAWPELQVLEIVHDGHAALRAVDALRPDLVFLDVEMPGLDGLAVARLIAGRAAVVFITAFEHYAVPAFDEGAVDYLLKPLDPARLVRALRRVRERLAVRAPAPVLPAPPDPAATAPLRWLSVQQGKELRLITVEEVCYFQADHKYVAVVTADSQALISTPLKDLLPRLDPDQFWQVHRSTVVNVQAIRAVSRSAIGGGLTLHLRQRPERLQVSASYAHRFRQM